MRNPCQFFPFQNFNDILLQKNSTQNFDFQLASQVYTITTAVTLLNFFHSFFFLFGLESEKKVYPISSWQRITHSLSLGVLCTHPYDDTPVTSCHVTHSLTVVHCTPFYTHITLQKKFMNKIIRENF